MIPLIGVIKYADEVWLCLKNIWKILGDSSDAIKAFLKSINPEQIKAIVKSISEIVSKIDGKVDELADSAKELSGFLGEIVTKMKNGLLGSTDDMIEEAAEKEIKEASGELDTALKKGEEAVEDTHDAGKVAEGKVVIIDDAALKHSSQGDFTYNPKTGKVSRMKGGGHGQDNIDFLEKNGIEYNIEKTYDNGVRVGNMPKHKTPSKRVGKGQAWFPETWSNAKIKEAGEHVANIKENLKLQDGVIAYGEYDGIRVGIIKTNGKVGTVFPDADMQP